MAASLFLGSGLKGCVPKTRGTGFRTQAACKAEGKFIIGGNWKANGTSESISELVDALNAGTIEGNVDVVCCTPSVYLSQVMSTLKAPYQVGAQNCWTGGGGAYTGETPAEMLADLKVPWVITGHSERRTLCGETNDIVGIKTAYALEKGLKVMACIGESLEEREAGITLNVCRAQLQGIADHVTDWTNVVIAYEPVWAIGTGKVATPEQAQEVHAGIRKWFADSFGADVANKIRIQYGGSVKADNCEELAAMEDIDGFLVGGAALDATQFLAICNACFVVGTCGEVDWAAMEAEADSMAAV